MNLQELLDALEAHPKTINLELLPDEDYGHYLFVRLTFFVETDLADQKSVCILVKDRGEPTEIAYYKGVFPFPDETFRDEVITKADAYQTNNPELEYYSLVHVDEGGPGSGRSCLGLHAALHASGPLRRRRLDPLPGDLPQRLRLPGLRPVERGLPVRGCSGGGPGGSVV